MHDLLKWTTRRELARELKARGHKVSGETLNRWVRTGEEIPPPVLREIRNILGLPETTKDPPPKWVRDLPEEVADEVVKRLGLTPEIVQAAAVELGLAERPRVEPDHAANATPPDTEHRAPRRPERRASR